jgi:hypothetical protein
VKLSLIIKNFLHASFSCRERGEFGTLVMEENKGSVKKQKGKEDASSLVEECSG